jgi:hypothetical protein
LADAEQVHMTPCLRDSEAFENAQPRHGYIDSGAQWMSRQTVRSRGQPNALQAAASLNSGPNTFRIDREQA